MAISRNITIRQWRTHRDTVPSSAAWIALMMAACTAGAALILIQQVIHG